MGKHWGQHQGDTCRSTGNINPESSPGSDDKENRGKVDIQQEVAYLTTQKEDHLQASEGTNELITDATTEKSRV